MALVLATPTWALDEQPSGAQDQTGLALTIYNNDLALVKDARKLKLKPDLRVCALVSGGNIDLNLLARVIESGLAASGFYDHLQLRLRDDPGHLAPLLNVVSKHKGNVLDVQHYRAGWKVPVGWVDVEILIETRNPGVGEVIARELAGAGYQVTRTLSDSNDEG